MFQPYLLIGSRIVEIIPPGHSPIMEISPITETTALINKMRDRSVSGDLDLRTKQYGSM